MRLRLHRRNFCHWVLGVLTVAFVLTGCFRGPSAAKRERFDVTDATLREALAAQKSGDFQKAADLFERVALVQPTNALAHLQLAILQQDCLNDPFSAALHFKAYLKLSPDAEKVKLVNEKLAAAKAHIMAGCITSTNMFGTGGVANAVQKARDELTEKFNAEIKKTEQVKDAEIAALQAQKERNLAEISRLRILVETMSDKGAVSSPPTKDLESATLDSSAARRTVPQTATLPPRQNVPDNDTNLTYKVKPGDTLYGISKKFYGSESRSDEILQANKGIIQANGELQEGAVLLIPPR